MRWIHHMRYIQTLFKQYFIRYNITLACEFEWQNEFVVLVFAWKYVDAHHIMHYIYAKSYHHIWKHTWCLVWYDADINVSHTQNVCVWCCVLYRSDANITWNVILYVCRERARIYCKIYVCEGKYEGNAHAYKHMKRICAHQIIHTLAHIRIHCFELWNDYKYINSYLNKAHGSCESIWKEKFQVWYDTCMWMWYT